MPALEKRKRGKRDKFSNHYNNSVTTTQLLEGIVFKIFLI